jgi:adenylate kinase family enzyme
MYPTKTYQVPPSFKVEWQGSLEKTMKRIFHNLIVSTIKDDKPCVILITGKSGTGKSSVALSIADDIYGEEQLDFLPYVQQSVVMEITEFGDKVKAVLYEKELKKCFLVILDEARKTVNKDDWRSVVNRTVAMVNALSREVKPLAIIIITQSLRDIDINTRDTIDYYVKCKRSLRHPTEASFYEFWVDDSNVDKPKMKKKIVMGNILEAGKARTVKLYNVEFHKPREEIWKAYKGFSYDSKTKMLEQEFNNLANALKSKYNDSSIKRTQELAQYLHTRKDLLNDFAQFKRKRWQLTPEFCTNFNVSVFEKKEIEKLLLEKNKDDINLSKGDDDNEL